jgi:Icc-related predicted phosphoesterase
VIIHAMSDLHGMLPPPGLIPKSDILVLAGDNTPVTNHLPSFQVQWLDTEYRRWLKSLQVGTIVEVAGNHDFAYQTIPERIPTDLPRIYLQDSGVEIEGLKLWGTPWTPQFGRWAFMDDEDALRGHFDKIPEGIDILISHGPPRDVLDRNVGGYPCGSTSLRSAIERVKPRAVVCGHIHEAYGTDVIGGTRIYNVSHVNFNYRPVNSPVEIILERP